MAISRMQEPRQLYGLGSLVKSIGKTVKKVVKSDLGKAALLAAGGYYLGGGSLLGAQRAGMSGFKFANLPGFTGAKNLLMGKPLGFKTAGDAVARSGGILDIGKKFLGSTAGQVGIGTVLSALAAGGMDQEEITEIKNDPEKLRMYLKDYYSKTNPDASGAEIEEFVRINSAVGGRVGFADGKNMKMASMDENEKELMRLVEEFMERGFSQQEAIEEAKDTLERKSIAIGGRVGLESGTPKKGLESLTKEDMEKFILKMPGKIEYDKDGNPIKREIPKIKGPYKYDPDREIPTRLLRNKSAMGGLQSMPMGQMRRNKAGTIERDYRETGGFVPVGIKEKADDVPAMLSKNEFVMTADAVRGIGDGNIEKGAQRLYDQMKQAEKRVV